MRRFSAPLLRLLRNRVRNPWMADDIHQETFRVVLMRLRRAILDRPEDVAGFIVATANNILRAERRKSMRDVSLDESFTSVLRCRSSTPADVLLREETRNLVLAAIARLSTKRDRDILHRYYILEEPKEQIRADLGLSDLHFNRVLFRARERLRSILISRRAVG